MLQEYHISVELSRKEITSYNFLPIRWLLILDLIGLILLLLCAYFSIVSPDQGVRETLGVLSLWGALFLAVGFSQPFILILQIYVLKSPAVDEQMRPKSYTFDDAGIHVRGENRSALLAWSKVLSVKETRKLLLIYTSPKLAYIIPKRYFGSYDDFRQFTTMLLRNIQPSTQ